MKSHVPAGRAMTDAGGPGGRGRAGRYVLQPAGYRAFVPAPLPPRPPMRMTGVVQARLSAADRALGRLDGAVHTLPEADLFVLMYVRKEAVLSSQIEGAQSSLRDMLAAEARLPSPRGAGDAREVINYVAAVNHGLERLPGLPPSVRLIREMHERLVQGVRGGGSEPGELRRSQNWIGPAGSTPGCVAWTSFRLPSRRCRARWAAWRFFSTATTISRLWSGSAWPMPSSRRSIPSSTATAGWGGC